MCTSACDIGASPDGTNMAALGIARQRPSLECNRIVRNGGNVFMIVPLTDALPQDADAS